MRKQDLQYKAFRNRTLLAVQILFLFAFPAPVLADSAPLPGLGPDAATSVAPELSAEPKAIPETAQLIVLPYLVDGELSCLSILDSRGVPVSGATVSVDQEFLTSSNSGVVAFKVPHADSFEICLYTEGKRKLLKRKFLRRGTIYAENEQTAAFISRLLKSADTNYGAPLLLWAPAILKPGSMFLLLGKNFSPNLSEDLVNIDGSDLSVLASSSEALIAAIPEKLSAGPSRELIVSCKGQSSNISELDIATPFFDYEKSQERQDEDVALVENGRVGVKYSAKPCLIRIKNLNPEAATLWSPTQEPLWKNNIVLTPGSPRNYVKIGVRRLLNSAEPNLELSIENTLSPDGELLQAQALQSAACRAEILQLACKKNAAEAKLDQLRKNSGEGSSSQSTSCQNKPSENAQKNAGLNSTDAAVGTAQTPENKVKEEEGRLISNKLFRISRMLASRKALFEALGNAEAEYRKALDDASGGAISAIEEAGRVQIISDASSASGAETLKLNKKGRPLRMLEPPIRLLPPMSQAELAAMNSNPNSASENGGTSSAASSSSNEPQLRPGLPEPEPEVSADSRAQLGGAGDASARLNEKAAAAAAAGQADSKKLKCNDAPKTEEKKKVQGKKSKPAEKSELKSKAGKKSSKNVSGKKGSAQAVSSSKGKRKRLPESQSSKASPHRKARRKQH